VEEAKQAFYDSIDGYIEFCQELGEEPNRPAAEIISETA
jgi:predicted HicB family RNase H-like nuclease